MSISFTPLFGNAPHARVLDFLFESDVREHTLSGLARGARVARPTVYKVVRDLKAQGVLRERRVGANARYVALDGRSATVRRLARVQPIVGRRARA